MIPAFNAESTIAEAVRSAMKCAAADVLVVDAGSTDITTEIACRLGASVISFPQREGPSRARNRGANEVPSDVVLFLDSDCVLHSDAVERVRRAFAENPRLVSLTGSYDDSPPHRNFFSQYLNLRHHLTHQLANRDNATFWAGCGAVRRDAFLQVGGFDEQRYPEPQIEDIELGLRLRKLGATRLDPDLQVKHLKRWTLWSVITTDIRSRAIPWSQLILEQGEIPDDLNLRMSQRIAALIAPLVLLGLPLSLWAAVHLLVTGRAAPTKMEGLAGLILVGSTGLAMVSLILNSDLVKGFARLRGAGFALGGWLFHQVHLTYSLGAFAICWLRQRLGRAT